MLLTIIVVNYNQGCFLSRCLSSILEKAPDENFEILIVDDKSTDDSVKEIQRLSNLKHIRYFCRTMNGGVEAAVNSGIERAKGEYLHLFAVDDLYLPGSLKKMLECIKQNPHISIFCSDYASFQEQRPEKILSKKNPFAISDFRFFLPNQTHSLFRHTDFWLPGHTVYVKKSVLLPYLPQDKGLGPISDWYMYHQIALNHGVGYLPKPLIARRENAHSYSSSVSRTQLKAIWHYLLKLNPPKKLIQTGIFRMFGLRAIYGDLLKTPRYWKYVFPMGRKEIEKQFFSLLGVDRNQYWFRRL